MNCVNIRMHGPMIKMTPNLSDDELGERERGGRERTTTTISSHIQVNMVLCINTKIQAPSGFCLPNNLNFLYLQPTP